MAEVIELDARGGALRLDTDDDWCRCWLVGDRERYLGADKPHVVLVRLLKHLERAGEETLGELDGHPVRWVLSLAEEHSTLYAGLSDGQRLLYIQDSTAKLIGQLTISVADWERWRRALEDALGGQPSG